MVIILFEVKPPAISPLGSVEFLFFLFQEELVISSITTVLMIIFLLCFSICVLVQFEMGPTVQNRYFRLGLWCAF